MTPGIESQYYDIAERVAQMPGVQRRGIHAGASAAELGLVEQLDRFRRQGRASAPRGAVLDRAALCHPRIFRGTRHSDSQRARHRIDRHGNSPRVILINETLARTYFGTADPVGVEMNRGRIVGVVGDVRQVELDRPAVPEIYFPMAQNWSQVADLGMTLVVRTTGSPNAVIDAVRCASARGQSAHRDLQHQDDGAGRVGFALESEPVSLADGVVRRADAAAVGSRALRRDLVQRDVSPPRVGRAARARICRRADVARIVLMRGLALAAIGVSAGMVLTLLAIRAFGAEFPPSRRTPAPQSFAAVAASMFAIALGASWLPALRVARIAPAAALRAE